MIMSTLAVLAISTCIHRVFRHFSTTSNRVEREIGGNFQEVFRLCSRIRWDAKPDETPQGFRRVRRSWLLSLQITGGEIIVFHSFLDFDLIGFEYRFSPVLFVVHFHVKRPEAMPFGIDFFDVFRRQDFQQFTIQIVVDRFSNDEISLSDPTHTLEIAVFLRRYPHFSPSTPQPNKPRRQRFPPSAFCERNPQPAEASCRHN